MHSEALAEWESWLEANENNRRRRLSAWGSGETASAAAEKRARGGDGSFEGGSHFGKDDARAHADRDGSLDDFESAFESFLEVLDGFSLLERVLQDAARRRYKPQHWPAGVDVEVELLDVVGEWHNSLTSAADRDGVDVAPTVAHRDWQGTLWLRAKKHLQSMADDGRIRAALEELVPRVFCPPPPREPPPPDVEHMDWSPSLARDSFSPFPGPPQALDSESNEVPDVDSRSVVDTGRQGEGPVLTRWCLVSAFFENCLLVRYPDLSFTTKLFGEHSKSWRIVLPGSPAMAIRMGLLGKRTTSILYDEVIGVHATYSGSAWTGGGATSYSNSAAVADSVYCESDDSSWSDEDLD
jgi:hypothetical protein